MILQLEQGYLEGGVSHSLITGRKFYTFYGIPYGEPPVGELRFRPPVPAGNWKGILDAKVPHDWCVQNDMLTRELVGTEDCLFVNVFTPEPPNIEAPLKPVIVHLCGGAFVHSTEHITGSFDQLVDYDVIMVTVSYRVHIFGDPNNVTVYGESSGACMTNMLSLSPMAKGLFHKAIVVSGSALMTCALGADQTDVGFAVGRSLGYNGTDPEELVAFLRQQPAVALNNAAQDELKKFIETHPLMADLLFCITPEKFPETAFISEHPGNLVKTAPRIPTMAGVTEKEGTLVVLATGYNNKLMMDLEDDLTNIVKHNVRPCKPSDIPRVVDELKKFYLRHAKTDKEIRIRLIDLFSDLVFKSFYDSFKHAEPLYVFEFAQVGGLSESLHRENALPGYAGHGDACDHVVLRHGIFPNPQVNDEDRKMIKIMCSIYTNFARTGNPNPVPTNEVKWVPHTTQNHRYLKITSEPEMKNGDVVSPEGRAFWEHIRKTYVES